MNKILFLFVASVIFSTEAQAYLDGGTGSMILQLLLGGAVGFAAVIKLYWYRIKSFFSRSSLKD